MSALGNLNTTFTWIWSMNGSVFVDHIKLPALVFVIHSDFTFNK